MRGLALPEGPPLDLVAAQALADQKEQGDGITVSVSWFRRALEEIRNGRVAAAELGRQQQLAGVMFGIQGETL